MEGSSTSRTFSSGRQAAGRVQRRHPPDRQERLAQHRPGCDTSNDPRQSRIFDNKHINFYRVLTEFYGLEEAIEQVLIYFRHAVQGLEEKKQILYLLGPVGGGNSSTGRASRRTTSTMAKFGRIDRKFCLLNQ